MSFTSTIDAVKREIFFDPATYQCLGTRDAMVETHDGRKKGSVVWASAVLRMAYVDALGALPPR